MIAIPFIINSPIAISIFGFEIYWYAICYVLGIVHGYIILKKLNSTTQILTEKSLDDIFVYLTCGIIIGGRLGFYIFYNTNWTDPLLLFKIREGGMSFHGGLAGVILGLIILCKKYNLSFLRVADMISCVAPIGIFYGRIGNFINAELYGTITDLPWGVIFPNAGLLPRHPTQIYEALTEGLLLFIFLRYLFPKLHIYRGLLAGIFLLIYGIVRFNVEFLKIHETDSFIITEQILTVPMIFLGLFLIKRSKFLSYSNLG